MSFTLEQNLNNGELSDLACACVCVCMCLAAKGVSTVCTNSHSSSRTELSSQAFSSAPSTSMKTQMHSSAPSRKQRSVHRYAHLMSPKFSGVCSLPYAETSLVFWCQNTFRVKVRLFSVRAFLASPQNQFSFLLLRARPWASSTSLWLVSVSVAGVISACVFHCMQTLANALLLSNKTTQLALPVIRPG